MCLACEMDQEFWLAYEDYLARRAKEMNSAEQPQAIPPQTSQFMCEEPSSE